MAMTAQEVHHVGENSNLSIEALQEVEQVNGATKRLSLNEKCPRCSENLQPSTKSSSTNSWPSLKENLVTSSLNNEFQQAIVQDEVKPSRGLQFWSIIVAVIVVGTLSALEGTIIGTALPTIVEDLDAAGLYLWAVNGYFLTSMVFQPLYGQTANIFGRRKLLIFCITVFLVGSSVCGAARNISMLIAGRAIQGVGAGGMNMLSHLIICDITSLRERGNFMAVIYGFVTVGTGIGPFVGAVIVQNTTWRWIFYLNAPIGGLALLLVIAFLQVNYDKESTISAKLKRIDYIGNAIFIPSLVSILLALTWGGTTYAWSSWRIISPLVIGFVGLGVFVIFEWTQFCVEPTTPPQLFANRTTVGAFAISFFNSMLLYWMLYWLPVYFQSVLESSPMRCSVQLLPFVLVMIPFSAVGGKVLAIFGRYRIIHHFGFAIMTAGIGLMTRLSDSSSAGSWVVYQILAAAGCGLLSSTLLPAVQAPLDEKDTATATATWAFIRSFGTIFSVTIPAAIFSNQFKNLSGRIGNPMTRDMLLNGHAYEHATSSFIKSFNGTLKAEIISVYSDSLKLVWQIASGIAGLGFLLVFVEKEIKLRTDLKTDYGIEETKEKLDIEGVV